LCSGVLLAFSGAAAAAGSPASTFDIIAGAGTAMRPTYIGSDRYRVSPVPLVSVKWNDMVALSAEGLRVYWNADRLTVGAGLTFDGGRDEKDKNAFSFGSGDDRLKGLGKIDASVGYQVFASYRLWRIDLDATAIKYDGNQNKGLVVRAGAALPVHLTNRLVITPHVGAQWANDRTMQTYFGVSDEQALRSGFARFDARGGVSGVTGGLKANYAITNHWFAMADVSTTALMGDAKHSPLSFSNSATIAFTAIGYHF
jgi:outer membrane scaffolding protein for murein synthesis (MipA/OmpV family)